MIRRWAGAAVAMFAFTAVAFGASETQPIDKIAERYVHLVLSMGLHDKDYVDAFYGPAEWKTAAEKEKKPVDRIGSEAKQLREELADTAPPEGELEQLRREYLTKQLSALEARVRMLKGERLTFDEESRALYDAVAPKLPESHFQQILERLERVLDGAAKRQNAEQTAGAKTSVSERYEQWRKRFIIPKEKLDNVFQLAIEECRKRTLAHVKLPPNESFTVEYVTGKSWSGYNWYQGNYRSLIQVNTDLPVYIDRAVDLAAHEGYPGHHVYNVLLEKNLARDRGWPEFMVYALFSPQSLIAEGTANYGKSVVFTPADRMKFEKEVLFPAAGLDPALADEYYAVQEMTEQLSYAGNEAARRYLNGEIDAAAAAEWLEKYALMTPPRAQQRVRFIDQYRSYVINYNLGEDMVQRYVDAQVDRRTKDGAEKGKARWEVFTQLLSSPRLPSGL